MFGSTLMSPPPPPLTALLRRPRAVWLAVLVAVFAALAPTLSHALVLARGGPPPLLEVCTSIGMQGTANALPADSPDGQESAPSLAHCPFCLLSTERAVPAPQVLAHLFAALGEHGEPTILQASFFLRHFALTPPPRGPPAILIPRFSA